MLSLAFSLLIAATVSFAFKTTRSIGVLCIALFTYVFPWVALCLLASALTFIFIFRSR